jgi:hypothetical protein
MGRQQQARLLQLACCLIGLNEGWVGEFSPARSQQKERTMQHGLVPSRWLLLLGSADPRLLLRVLKRVDERGIDHGDADAIYKVFQEVTNDQGVERMAKEMVEFDREKTERLREAYIAAVESDAEQFTFDGHEFLTRYAKYMLEFLDAKFKD